MQICISVFSMISFDSYNFKLFLWVHTILQNNLLDIIQSIYNLKETSGCAELLV